MRKLLPFGLLIPVAVLIGFFVASRFGYTLAYGTPANLLLGAAAWLLLFLIVFGYMRGWRSVRVFLVVFVVGKFSAILYHQLTFGLPVGRVMLELTGAAIFAWFLIGFFWPRRVRNEKASD